MASLGAYIPMDRRRAIAWGEELPERTRGAALFADVSGFTPLTEALVRDLGSRRSAEELTEHLNDVYSALIAEVHRYGGSVVSFAGDAITCWFDGSATSLAGQTELRATTCALSMQEAMGQFAEVKTRSGSSVSLEIKAAVAAGPARRFLVGDPRIQLLDVIVGATLDRMARAGEYARKGEVLVSAEVFSQLGSAVQIAEWREAVRDKEHFAVVSGLTHKAGTGRLAPLSAGIEESLTEEQIRAWILPPVYDRLRTGQGRYLAELRPADALFVKFSGLDYDGDDSVSAKLDAYVRWVQTVLARHQSYLLQLITGDKGSYLYAAFGAPQAHDNDASRAVAAAMELSLPPAEMRFIKDVRIGVSQGQMRAGAYGSPTRHTYGVLGDEVTIAARLMGEAGPGEAWVSQFVADGAARDYRFEYLDTIPLKGKRKPMQVFRPLGRQRGMGQTSARAFGAPLVGRDDELGQMEQALEMVLEGKGQIFRLEGRAGVGKSHLVARFVEMAEDRGFQVAMGNCQSTGQGVAYSCWRSVFRALFNLTSEPSSHDPDSWTTGQVNHVQAVVGHTNLDLLPRLPLLGGLLGFRIADNPTTAALDPELRQQWLFALVIELLQSWTSPAPSTIQAGGESGAGKALSVRLQQVLDTHLSQGELRTLCYNLNLDYDGLAGESKMDKAGELVGYFERSRRISELLEVGSRLRPDIIWGPTLSVRAETGRLPRPLLLLVDDAQWMDEASRRMTLSLGWAIAQSPILLLLVHRSEDEPVLPDLNRLPYHHCVVLDELEPGGVASMLSHRLHGELSALALSLVQSLVQGNPFFAVELLGALRASEVLVQQAGTWTLSEIVFDALRRGRCLARENGDWILAPDARLSALELDIPNSIHSTVLSRVDRLLEESKLTLKVASVIGRAVALGLLAQSHPDRPDLEALLEQVKELEICDLVRQRISRLGVLSCEFRSNIIQEVAYGTLLEEQRRELHLAAGRALEELQPDSVEELAYHYVRSCVRDKAAAYLDKAARKAQQEYANELALSYYSQALTVKERWQWRKGKVDVLHILGRREEEWAELEELRENPDAPAFEVAYLQGQYYEAMGAFAEARAAIREAEMACSECGDAVGQARCLNQVGLIAFKQGDFESAKARYSEALRLLREEKARPEMGPQAVIQILRGLGSVYLQQGEHGQARTYFDRALALSRTTGDRLSEAALLNHVGMTAFVQRDFEQAHQNHQQALEIRHEIGDRIGEGASLGNLALAVREMGDYTQAERYLLGASDVLQAIGDRFNQVNLWLNLGGTYLELGDLHKAEDYLRRGLALSREIGDASGEAYVLVNLGRVVCESGDPAKAEKLLANGLAMATEQKDKFLMASFQRYLSLASLEAGQFDRAVAQSRTAQAGFQELALRTMLADDLATQAAVGLATGDVSTASTRAREALAILEECGGEGPEFPARDYYLCSQALLAAGETEVADAALQAAYDLVLARATKIVDDALRRSFLEQVDVHRAIVRTYEGRGA